EKCPNCGSQLISCGCFMYYRIYDCMEQIPNREPHFAETSSCARCGKKEPDMKMVDLKDWEDICGSTYDVRSMLCSECMDFIIKKRNLIIGRHKEVRK
ncbi:MAG TPA: hypothetical protein VJ912_01440, partial [Candidatus Nanoarchaeia archaeon]|nr:hypothetical protein [Candidatus Nanoarchaeia archaeon]